MFAFAIWDGARGRLFCARDRLGIKPFYYATPADHFIFASEIKGLLPFPGLDPAPDDEAVLGFLVHGNCDYRERTILRQVKALPAAHALTLDLATRQVKRWSYWDPAPKQDWSGLGDAGRVELLRSLLLSTTRSHLISDVRAGSCLSGGLDSSAVVALIGKIWREQPEAASAVGDQFHTFTSCYEYPELDERGYALEMANAIGATSNLVFPAAADFWESFGRMAWHQDMPFSGLSFYAQWRVMRAAKEAGVKVLLDGQGGDEVFGGYAKFRYAYLASLLRSGRLGTMGREALASVLQRDLYLLDIRRGYRYLPGPLRSLLGVDSLLQRVLRADRTRAWVTRAPRPPAGGAMPPGPGSPLSRYRRCRSRTSRSTLCHSFFGWKIAPRWRSPLKHGCRCSITSWWNTVSRCRTIRRSREGSASLRCDKPPRG